MLDMINTMLEISQTDYRIDRTPREKVELGAFLKSVVELYSVLAEENGIQLTVSVPDGPVVFSGHKGKLQQLAGNLLVATGTMERSYAQKRLTPIARLILDDQFWRSQTEQLNVLPDGTVELIPRVGDHVIYLGSPVGVARKLERLRKFYKYGLSHAGWSRYKRISVEFDNQIVCKRNS